MCATKDQERKALERIQKIVEALGENSYVGTALEGCLEDASVNIENDFMQSMKGRYETAIKDAEHFQVAANHFSAEVDKLEQEVKDLKRRLLPPDDITDIQMLIETRVAEAENKKKEASDTIVKFAERPISPQFLQAVRDHRNAEKDETYFSAMLARIKALGQNCCESSIAKAT